MIPDISLQTFYPAQNSENIPSSNPEDIKLLWSCLSRSLQLPQYNDPNQMCTWINKNSDLLQEVTSLCFYSFPLQSLPREILLCTHLEILTLGRTKITEIPEWISELSCLKHLNIRYTQVSSLPESLGLLSCLEGLDLSYTEITVLPDWIGNFPRLKSLRLPKALSSLPWVIGNLSLLEELCVYNTNSEELSYVLCRLPELQDLSIRDSNLTPFPNALGGCRKLKKLFLWSCQFDGLSACIDNLHDLEELDIQSPIKKIDACFQYLTKLRAVTLKYSELQSLPESFSHLTSLQYLNVEGNQISCWPEALCSLPQLKEIQGFDNPISSLPEAFGNLTALKSLVFGITKLQALPHSITNLSQLKYVYVRDCPMKRSSLTAEMEAFFSEEGRNLHIDEDAN